VFLAPRADQGLVLLEQNGIAGFRTPESCADAVNAYLNWSVPAPPAEHAGCDLTEAAAVISRSQGARLNECDSCRLFAALGIKVAESRVLTQAADCAGIQFRILNSRKGPAVRATRAQADRKLYKAAIRAAVATYSAEVRSGSFPAPEHSFRSEGSASPSVPAPTPARK